MRLTVEKRWVGDADVRVRRQDYGVSALRDQTTLKRGSRCDENSLRCDRIIYDPEPEG